MIEENRSSVFFQGNLMLRTGSLRDDVSFLESIHDHRLLRVLKEKRYPLTSVQELEYEQRTAPCCFSPPGDFAVGMVLGKRTAVCRCVQTDCIHFQRCRPDITEDELRVLEENRHPVKLGPAPVPYEIPSQPLADRSEDYSYEYNAAVFGSAFDDVVEASSRLSSSWTSTPDWSSFEDHSMPYRIRQEWRDWKAELADPFAGLLGESSVQEKLPPLWTLFGPETNSEREADAKESASQPSAQAAYGKLFHRFRPVDQSSVVAASPSARQLVNAGPGTGKTWTLIERIIHLVEMEGVEPEDIVVLCYSRSAKQVIRTRLIDAAEQGRLRCRWQEVDIRTLDSYSGAMRQHVLQNEPTWMPSRKKRKRDQSSYEVGIETGTALLLEHPELSVIRHLIVDEIQDVVGVRASFLLALLASLPESTGFTLFGDACQAIYDYSVEENKMSSQQFYESLLEEHPDAERLSFSKNYRAASEQMTGLTVSLRRSILHGTEVDRAADVDEILSSLRSVELFPTGISDTGCWHADPGSTGILARNNGEALSISTHLRDRQIDHTLELTGQTPHFDGWIADMLDTLDGQIISCSDFADVFMAKWPGIDPVSFWIALTEMQLHPNDDRFEIRDVLRGLSRAEGTALYHQPNAPTDRVQVMTVHKAKGREFDHVLVPFSLFSHSAGYIPEDEHQESRVRYVALSRGRQDLQLFSLPPSTSELRKYISPQAPPEDPGRWYGATRRSGGYRLRQIELGRDRDILDSSFGSSAAVQAYIRDCVRPGWELAVQLSSDRPLRFMLVDPDFPNLPLAEMSHLFMGHVRKLKQPRNSKKNWPYPEEFKKVYVSRVVTCVASAEDAPPAARIFGDYAYWRGLEVCSLASSFTSMY